MLRSAVQAHSVSIHISSAPQIAEIFTLAPLATRIQVCPGPTLAGCHAFPVVSTESIRQRVLSDGKPPPCFACHISRELTG